MKILIQLMAFTLIGILTPVFIGLLFLVTPIIWLWRKVDTYIGSDMGTVIDNESAAVNNNSIRDRVLWSS